jgi:molybdenum cofactor synthesis domain-containing protein
MTQTAAILIIGNEILSGRTQDTNIQYLAKRLSELGIRVTQALVIPDETPVIVKAVRDLASHHTYVFTTGGIGFTHDDKTAVSLAEAFEVAVEEHPEALRRLKSHYGDDLNEARRRMALMPTGSVLIDNPVSGAPAFQIQNVFALAGVPIVMQAMFESLIGRLATGIPIQYTTVSCDLMEGVIADELARLQDRYPDVEIGSYPYFKSGVWGVSLVMRGVDKDAIANATQDVIAMVRDLDGVPEVV